jgi:hypothetical protein
MSKPGNLPSSSTVDWRRVPSQVALCVIFLLFLSLGQLGGQNKAQRMAAPPRLQKAIGCLVAADYIQQYGLKPTGIRVGDLVWVRYGIGSIPGIGGTPGLWNIIIYSQNGQRATLLFADPNHRAGFEAIRNGYNLVKHGSRWAASGGEGGFRDYEAVGRYATVLSRRSRYRVRLLPGGPECTQQKN